MGTPQNVILIVDDAPENITILSETLGDEYRVLAATTGRRALAIAKEKIPDLIMLDIVMPEMDGYDICRKLKADPATAHIPVIFVSSMSELTDELEGLSLGAVDYLTKPLWPPLVKLRVKNQISLLIAHREIARLNKRFEAYLSPEVSAGIKQGRVFDDLTSSNKDVTVFFSDIVGFTQKVESLNPAQLTQNLNRYFQSMNRIIARHGGTLDKYIGDEIMVFFGDPVSRGDKEDATACVSMAVDMLKELRTVKEHLLEDPSQVAFDVRIGISTGTVTVGNFGSDHKLDYTIIGNPVNMAARLESKANTNSIIICDNTWKLVSDNFECQKGEILTLKGLTNPVQTYVVVT